ncbi:hypothetical protein [Methylobacterium sp. J-068]|uniref:hypothetical protein n=1 Tax=Methylobacterium sp. J-068 TaxID=2836649 RepID=UPI001FB94AD1|nr:hypothetical protein [Methylobacterium sp. J-068]MCJ2032629.1 hypothetical protein [Methylobacterium sp. J-068]
MADTRLHQLGRELIELTAAEAFYYGGPENTETDAAEEERLAAWSASVDAAIIAERPTTREGLLIKLAAVARYNTYGALTWEDRFAEGATSDAIAWSIVRDLSENPALLNPGESTS